MFYKKLQDYWVVSFCTFFFVVVFRNPGLYVRRPWTGSPGSVTPTVYWHTQIWAFFFLSIMARGGSEVMVIPSGYTLKGCSLCIQPWWTEEGWLAGAVGLSLEDNWRSWYLVSSSLPVSCPRVAWPRPGHKWWNDKWMWLVIILPIIDLCPRTLMLALGRRWWKRRWRWTGRALRRLKRQAGVSPTRGVLNASQTQSPKLQLIGSGEKE